MLLVIILAAAALAQLTVKTSSQVPFEQETRRGRMLSSPPLGSLELVETLEEVEELEELIVTVVGWKCDNWGCLGGFV